MSFNIGSAVSVSPFVPVLQGVFSLSTPESFVVSEFDHDSITMTWEAVDNATTYSLERATMSNYSDATEIYNNSTTSFEDTGLDDNTTYYYRVKAQAVGYSDSDYATLSQATDYEFNEHVQAYIDYLEQEEIELPSLPRLIKLNTLVDVWVSNGTWASKAVIWVWHTDSQGASVINLKNPGNNTWEPVGGMTFTENYGWVPNGTDQYGNTHFNPNTQGGSLWLTNEACMEMYIANNVDIGTNEAALSASTPIIGFYPNPDGSGFTNIYINSSTVFGAVAPTGSNAYWKLYRTQTGATPPNTKTRGFKNGSSYRDTDVNHTLGIPNQDIYTSARNSSGSDIHHSTIVLGCLLLGLPNAGDEVENAAAWAAYIS